MSVWKISIQYLVLLRGCQVYLEDFYIVFGTFKGVSGLFGRFLYSTWYFKGGVRSVWKIAIQYLVLLRGCQVCLEDFYIVLGTIQHLWGGVDVPREKCYIVCINAAILYLAPPPVGAQNRQSSQFLPPFLTFELMYYIYISPYVFTNFIKKSKRRDNFHI